MDDPDYLRADDRAFLDQMEAARATLDRVVTGNAHLPRVKRAIFSSLLDMLCGSMESELIGVRRDPTSTCGDDWPEEIPKNMGLNTLEPLIQNQTTPETPTCKTPGCTQPAGTDHLHVYSGPSRPNMKLLGSTDGAGRFHPATEADEPPATITRLSVPESNVAGPGAEAALLSFAMPKQPGIDTLCDREGCPLAGVDEKHTHMLLNGKTYAIRVVDQPPQTPPDIGFVRGRVPETTGNWKGVPLVLPVCDCRYCIHLRGDTVSGMPRLSVEMIVCPDCGNKRCPHASSHIHQCTRSNASGQPGSDC